MTFPRADYRPLGLYQPDKRPVDIDLSDNTNQWGAHPAAVERIRGFTERDLRGYPEAYADELRDAVSERYGVAPECVTTGVGSDDVLDLTFRAAGGDGAILSYPAPTFVMVASFARMNGIDTHPVPWPDALDDPGRLLEGDPAAVYVCRPNNPTSALAPLAWVERLLELRGDDGPLVVLDEAYAEFSKDTLISRAPSIPRLIVARTASKAFGLAGLRCGFGVAEPETAREIEKSRGPFKVTCLAVAAMAAALRDRSDWLERTVEECIANRGRLLELLRERGLQPFDSRTNFVMFAPPTGDAKADAAALRERGIAVRPFAGVPEIDQGLRATVGRSDQIERFVAALDELLERAESG